MLDMATSALPWYTLVEASVTGRRLPEGVAFDGRGAVTTDPDEAMRGAMRPFDLGAKGSGLALIVEVLTGPLVGAGTAGTGTDAEDWGNLVLALDPTLLVPRRDFDEQVRALRTAVKPAKTLPDVGELLLPGERGARLAASVRAAGAVAVADEVAAGLREAAGLTG